MSDIAIKVEQLGKLYQLGEIGTGTLSHDLNRWWARMRGKEDPYTRIGEANDRTRKGESDFVWALKDVSFEVKKGEVLGIIGRNGAGKSTLLKLLSKVTTPTEGKIKVNGRIASLLEVGTGFHPDLTGRENIYLNGAILGMTKAEIRSKFDEIVDFAGVERYIDTPVKRYSSGMYVRLAFAVAAHLEPEILIIDEVLAVGDAEFQKKALGRMQDVSRNDGRTVLFVSHNMDAISRLCEKAVVMKNGTIEYHGYTQDGLKFYYDRKENNNAFIKWEEKKYLPGNDVVRLLEVMAVDENFENKETFDIRKKIGIKMRYKVLKDNIVFTHGMNLYSIDGIHILSSHDIETGKKKVLYKHGVYESIVWIPGNFLAEGIINVGVAIMSYDPFMVHFHEKETISFSVVDSIDGDSARGVYGGTFPGLIRPILNWQNKKL